MKLAVRFSSVHKSTDDERRGAAIKDASEASGGATNFQQRLTSRLGGDSTPGATPSPKAPPPIPKESKKTTPLVDWPTTYGRELGPGSFLEGWHGLPSSHTHGGNIWDEGRSGLERWYDHSDASHKVGIAGQPRDVDRDLHTSTGEHPDFEHGTVTYPGRLSPNVARGHLLKEIPSTARREELMSSAVEGVRSYIQHSHWNETRRGGRFADAARPGVSADGPTYLTDEELIQGRGSRGELDVRLRDRSLRDYIDRHAKNHAAHLGDDFFDDLKGRLLGSRSDTIPKEITTSAGHRQTVHVKKSDHSPPPQSSPPREMFPDGHVEGFTPHGDRVSDSAGHEDVERALADHDSYTGPGGNKFERHGAGSHSSPVNFRTSNGHDGQSESTRGAHAEVQRKLLELPTTSRPAQPPSGRLEPEDASLRAPGGLPPEWGHKEPPKPEDLKPSLKPEISVGRHSTEEEHHDGRWRRTGHNYDESRTGLESSALLSEKLKGAGLGESCKVHHDWYKSDGSGTVGDHRSHIKIGHVPFWVYSDRALDHFKKNGNYSRFPESWKDHDIYTPKAMEFRKNLDELSKSFLKEHGSPGESVSSGHVITHSFDRSLVGRDLEGVASNESSHGWGVVPKAVIHKDHSESADVKSAKPAPVPAAGKI